MANLTRTAKNVSAVTETKPHMRFYRANEALEPGQPCYLMSNGKIAPTDASAAGTAAPFVGLSLNYASANEPLSVIWDGSVEGFDLSGIQPGTTIYLSDDAGELADSAGTVSKAVGVVLPLTDAAGTKVLYIQARPF